MAPFSPDECQSKSFEKMNTLLSAIFILAYKNKMEKGAVYRRR